MPFGLQVVKRIDKCGKLTVRVGKGLGYFYVLLQSVNLAGVKRYGRRIVLRAQAVVNLILSNASQRFPVIFILSLSRVTLLEMPAQYVLQAASVCVGRRSQVGCEISW